jgi:hypothetical protein
VRDRLKQLAAYSRLIVDVLSMKLFLRLIGRDAEFLDAHLFFYGRYSELADHHRQRGRTAKALRLAAIAEEHYQAAPGDDDDDPTDPAAAAMAMPAPSALIVTNAVSTKTTRTTFVN